MADRPTDQMRRRRAAGTSGATNPAVVADDPEQSKRFVEAAKELGIEEAGEAYDRALGRILPPRTPGEPAPRAVKVTKPKGKRTRTRGA
jgi:hypothetical protein